MPSFEQICLFEALLNYCFVCLLRHIAVVLGREKVHFLEFPTASTRRRLGISFWEDNDLVTMTIADCSRDVFLVKSVVLICSQLECCFAGTNCFLLRGRKCGVY